MSITSFDIKKSAFTNDLDDVDEVTLSNRGLIDLGAIHEVPNLRVANLSFNKLSCVKALATLTRLHTLNLSHNQVTSLKGLASLTSLTQLNASHNQISSLAPLSALPSLRDLYLQCNALQEPPCLQPLASLPSLQRLCVSPNGLCKALGAGTSRLLLLRLCGSLQVLDAAAYTPEELSSSRASGPSDAEEAAQQLAIFSKAAGPAAAGRRSPTLSQLAVQEVLPRSGSGSLPRAAVHESGLPSAPFLGPGRLQSRALGQVSRGTGQARTRSASPGVRALSPSLGARSGSCSEAFDPSEAAERDSLGSTSSSCTSSTSGTGRQRAMQGRRAASSSFLPRIKTIPEGSSFLAVLDMLPKLDAKLPPNYTPISTTEAITKKPPPPRPPPEAQTVEYECRYPRHTQSRAVTVKRDGSLVSYWPNGDLAATVDMEYGGDAPDEPLFRMFAMYRSSGNVAVSFDSVTGGFVQYPNGNIAVIVNAGGGTVYRPSGETLLKWSAAEPDPPAPPPCVDLQLDSCYGVRYQRQAKQLQLYLACEGLRYVVLCGANGPGATWDPGQGPSEGQGPDGLPVPKFLAKLAQEGPATGAARAAGVCKESAAEAPRDMLSITNSLKALDDSLTAWALDRSAK